MERMALRDAHHSSRRSRSTSRRRRAHRLPTPGASRGSNEAIEMDVDMGDSRAADCADRQSVQNLDQRSTASLNSPVQSLSVHADARHQPAPHSPPYRDYDTQKPSLPPLKTVLGDNLSSPPPTPTILGAPFQPAPREPTYTTATYKPPSLYPHKRARLGHSNELAPSFSDASKCSSPGPLRTTLEPNAYEGSTDGRLMTADTPSYVDAHGVRRLSVQHLPSNGTNFRPSQSAPYPNGGPSAHGASAKYDRLYRHTDQHYRTPDHTPTAATFNPEFPATVLYASLRETDDRARRAPEYSSYSNESTRGPQHQRSTFLPAGRLRTAQSEQHGPYQEDDRVARPNHLPPPPYHRSPYASTPPSFFMPSQYDYQQGKARKRSNLPKQSTEIMKTWFDHNITNPYPSEEQKALFSRATGISMTQVSNWFINHRRRRPELRDRREKHRAGGRDCDML